MTDEWEKIGIRARNTRDSETMALLAELRRLRSELASLADDARLGRAIRDLDKACSFYEISYHDGRYCVFADDADSGESLGGWWCDTLIDAVEKAGRK